MEFNRVYMLYTPRNMTQIRRLVCFDSTCVMVIIFMFLLAVPNFAQELVVDTTFNNRNIRQQMFLIDYLKDNESENPPELPEEIDAFITTAEAAWAEEVKEETPLMGRFNPYVVMWLLHSAYKGEDPPQNTVCYMYSEYAVPAFLADFEQYSKVDPANAPLIRWGYDWVGGRLALKCEFETERWEKLFSAFEQAPSLYQKYLDTEAFADNRFAREIRQAKQFFERNIPLYAVRDAIYRGELSEAFADLAAEITNGHEAYYILPIGEMLWRAYIDAEKTDHALAVLDLLARSLTAGDLSRDTLLAWYIEVAPSRGSKRFKQSILSAPPTLVSSEKQAGLTGVYTDLLTEEFIDLTDMAGRFVFLDFWGTWCSPCIAEIPELLDFASEYDDRITIISINVDAHTGGRKQDGVREFMNEHEVEYTVLYDEPDNSLATRFGVSGYPAKFFINPEGAFLVHPSEDRIIVYLEEVKAYIDGLR